MKTIAKNKTVLGGEMEFRIVRNRLFMDQFFKFEGPIIRRIKVISQKQIGFRSGLFVFQVF